MNDLDRADPGDIFTHDGIEWVVSARYYSPVVVLRRADLSMGVADSYCTHLTVSPTSLYASKFHPKQPPVDPVLELARKLVAERSHTNSTTEDLLAGRNDDWASVQNAIKAIRAGMALARES